MDTRHHPRYLPQMNSVPPTPLIPEEELRLAEARHAAFDRDKVNYSMDELHLWIAARATQTATRSNG